MTPINFGTKRGFWLLRALGALGMAVAGAAMAVTGLTSVGLGSLTTWLGIVGLTFFGVAAVVGLVEGTRRGPRLTIDAHGVYDRTLRVGAIAWTDIAGAAPYWVAKKPFVALYVREPAKYVERASWLGRLLARLHVSSGLPPFSVNLVGLDADPAQVTELIISRCRLGAWPGAA